MAGTEARLKGSWQSKDLFLPCHTKKASALRMNGDHSISLADVNLG